MKDDAGREDVDARRTDRARDAELRNQRIDAALDRYVKLVQARTARRYRIKVGDHYEEVEAYDAGIPIGTV